MHVDPSRILSALVGATLFSLPLHAAEGGDAEEAPAVEMSEEEKQAEAMQKEIDSLQLKRQLDQARLEAELADANDKQRRLETAMSLARQEQETELATKRSEVEALNAEMDLQRQRLQKELFEMELERQRLEAASSLEQAKLQVKIAEIQGANQLKEMEIAKLGIDYQLASTALQAEGLELEKLNMQMQKAENKRMIDQQAQRFEMDDANQAMQKEGVRRQADAMATGTVDRPAEPFAEGVLRISDRRIELNDAIIEGYGNYVQRRIDFFNAKSDEPIFIVIDNCPGGSIMEGYRILKSMEASKAPIHVVVKSFAASMAAIILTEAPNSYAYRDAIILHHQPLSGLRGNLAEQRERVAFLETWAKRIHAGTAERMGITLDEFYKRMYEERVSGDWYVFADEAQKLKWVNHIANEIVEEGIRDMPSEAAPKPWWFGFFEADETGAARDPSAKRVLPRPAPFDAYLIYDADGRYHIAD